MWLQFKSGTWLTRERLYGYPLILLVVSLTTAMIWIALADGLIDRNGKPIGTDFSNVGHGQNGFLTATLLGGGLIFLERRPILAGVLLGLLAYKPQFGLLIPLVLLATGRWTAIAAATVTVLSACSATLIVFGPEV